MYHLNTHLAAPGKTHNSHRNILGMETHGGMNKSSRSRCERATRKNMCNRKSSGVAKYISKDSSHPSIFSVEETSFSPRFNAKHEKVISYLTDPYLESPLEDADRSNFIKTNSSLFFENNPDTNMAMKPIPISPMFEAKPGMTWSAEFFGRGGTSGPSKRTDSKETLLLPDLNTKAKSTRPLFSLDSTAAHAQHNMAMSPIFVSNFESSAQLKSSKAEGRAARPSLSASAIRPSPVKPVKEAHVSELQSDTAIEPWAVKIISKYQSKSVVRPQSRCTARLQQESDGLGGGLMGPPMGLGSMAKSKSLSHISKSHADLF